MGGGLNPSARAEVLCRFSYGVCVTVIKKPFTRHAGTRGFPQGTSSSNPGMVPGQAKPEPHTPLGRGEVSSPRAIKRAESAEVLIREYGFSS